LESSRKLKKTFYGDDNVGDVYEVPKYNAIQYNIILISLFLLNMLVIFRLMKLILLTWQLESIFSFVVYIPKLIASYVSI